MRFPSDALRPRGPSDFLPSGRRRRAKKRPPREPELPPEDRTHVQKNRFTLWCGEKRIGCERSRIVLDNPTCRACRTAIAESEKAAELMRKIGEEAGHVDW